MTPRPDTVKPWPRPPTGEFRAFFSKEFTSANIITNVTKQIEKYNASLKPF